jgi:subfamily B ATP-binding cassette protein MsbA
MKLIKVSALSSPVMELLGALGVALLLYLGGLDVISGKWTAGSFFAFIFAVFSFYQPLRELAGLNSILQLGRNAAERIFEVIGTKPLISEPKDAKSLKTIEKEIVFKDVYFTYPYTNECVLKNLNFKIEMGKTTAIIGPSGAGKTSLIYLLFRLFLPNKGTILIDNLDINEISSESLRKLISLVPQDIFLFNDTILNNIAYGSENLNENEIEEAARTANAHEFIINLPQGYNTIVGERGVKLSGGQKQRIAIARAIVRKPKLLIFDEATSALDAESEKLIKEAINKLMKFTTLVIITHRLSTIKNADKIIVLDKGEVVEQGTPEQLFQMDGIYKKFHQLQFM